MARKFLKGVRRRIGRSRGLADTPVAVKCNIALRCVRHRKSFDVLAAARWLEHLRSCSHACACRQGRSCGFQRVRGWARNSFLATTSKSSLDTAKWVEKKKEKKITAKMLRGRHDEPLTIPVWPLGDGNRYFYVKIDDRTGFYHLSCDAERGVYSLSVSLSGLSPYGLFFGKCAPVIH